MFEHGQTFSASLVLKCRQSLLNMSRIIMRRCCNQSIRLQSFTFNNKPSKIKHSIDFIEAPIKFKISVTLIGLGITGCSLYFLQENLLFGTFAGITAKTVTAPLERLTTHRQASFDAKYSIPSVIKVIYKEEGIIGFWRGNGLNTFRASIQKGSLFAMNDFFRSLFINKQQQQQESPPFISFLCGSLAGLTSTVITYPLDPIKTVNQATIHKERWPAINIWYSLSQQVGYLKGPWIAALPTMIGTSIYYGFKFLTFEEVIKRIDTFNDKNDFEIPRDLRNAGAGLFSGIIGNSITYPNNCIRKRMQTAHICQVIGIQSQYKPERYFKTAIRLYHEGGIPRLYRGFGINIIRNAPNTAIQFVVYKRLQRIWNQSQYELVNGI